MGGETISNMFNITHDMFNVQVKKPITAAAFTDLKSSMPKKVNFHIDNSRFASQLYNSYLDPIHSTMENYNSEF